MEMFLLLESHLIVSWRVCFKVCEQHQCSLTVDYVTQYAAALQERVLFDRARVLKEDVCLSVKDTFEVLVAKGQGSF